MAAEFRLGIQSYTFRTFMAFPDLVGALKECELDYVEIWPGHLSSLLAFSDAGGVGVRCAGGITPTALYGAFGAGLEIGGEVYWALQSDHSWLPGSDWFVGVAKLVVEWYPHRRNRATASEH